MVKIGWLHDDIGITGGAEISNAELMDVKPDWADVIECPPGRRPPDDIDMFVIVNCITYGERWVEPLRGKPLIKHFRDPWHGGSIGLRRFILDNVDGVIFNSPDAEKRNVWTFNETAIVKYIPPPVDLDKFRAASRPVNERRGNVFLGRVDKLKGIHRAIDWAMVHSEPLDVYGRVYDAPEVPDGVDVRFHGKINYMDVPSILGHAKRFIFLPGAAESYSRTTVEAWAAGCKLVVDWDLIGAGYWLREKRWVLENHNPENFWWEFVERRAESCGVL